MAENASLWLSTALRSNTNDKAPAEQEQLPPKMPRHVAIVMDGNGRWAKRRALPSSAGHAAGTEALRGIIRASDDWGIEALSIYAFSTENWARPSDEVSALMALLLRYFSSEIDELHEKNVRILILGDVNGLPTPQRDAVNQAMDRTRENTGLRLNIALNYGSRAELLRAAKSLCDRAQAGEAIDSFTEDDMTNALYTTGQPDVDLLIRTSGEMRLSNFLLWQNAYAELMFNDLLWPDYTRKSYLEDLWRYAARDRRFGKR